MSPSRIKFARVPHDPQSVPYGRRVRFYAAVLAAEHRTQVGVATIKAKREAS